MIHESRETRANTLDTNSISMFDLNTNFLALFFRSWIKNRNGRVPNNVGLPSFGFLPPLTCMAAAISVTRAVGGQPQCTTT